MHNKYQIIAALGKSAGAPLSKSRDIWRNNHARSRHYGTVSDSRLKMRCSFNAVLTEDCGVTLMSAVNKYELHRYMCSMAII